MINIWVIRNTVEKDEETGEALYWNNDDGWVSHDDATRFTENEKMSYHYLPMDGEWEICHNSAQQV